MTSRSRTTLRALHLLLLVTAAALLGLHFVHLTADFPNHSPWMDWSKYTDEGWYGDAAIRHYLLGHWYVSGDFNPAAALPVWPFAEALVFAFTGVSLAAARALTVCVFAGILIAAWCLVARHSRYGRWSLAATAGVLLLAASPFCFVFTRLAITEPLLTLLTLLALLTSGSLKPIPSAPAAPPLRRATATLRADPLPTILLGVLLPVMILTKTTALFLTPAVFWLVFARCGYRVRTFVQVAICPALLGLLLWLTYFFGIVRPHYLLDYRYLFSANAYTGMTRDNFLLVLSNMLRDGRWMGSLFYPLSLMAVAVVLVRWRRLAEHPLLVSLLLWSAGYMTFLAYHNNLQPRYYLVVAVPMTLLLVTVLEDLVLPLFTHPSWHAAALAIATCAVATIVVPDVNETLTFVAHPEYTLIRASDNLADYIRKDARTDPKHNPLILSISGSDISLITGLPSICDDFGTLELVDRVQKYRPGWYVAWNQIEDDKLDALWPLYRPVRVASFPAMDDPDRNLLILYKLVPADAVPPPPPGKHPPTPRRLRTKMGQQPSVEQLVH